MKDDGIPQFEEGEEYSLDELPENQMTNSGKLEWVDDKTLALVTEDRQMVELWWSSVEVTDVKYVDEDGNLHEERQ